MENSANMNQTFFDDTQQTSGSPVYNGHSQYFYGGQQPATDEYYDEPPLLEELEIYPERIIEKSLSILNPMHAQELNPTQLFDETDLAGPLIFCITLATALLLSGSKAHFGYIYSLSMMSVIGMYFLLTLMSNTVNNFISIAGVASILGYGLLPIVFLSILGVFASLNSIFGIILVVSAVALATLGTSKIFCLMTSDFHQRFLIAYPCALVYSVFTLLVLF